MKLLGKRASPPPAAAVRHYGIRARDPVPYTRIINPLPPKAKAAKVGGAIRKGCVAFAEGRVGLPPDFFT